MSRIVYLSKSTFLTITLIICLLSTTVVPAVTVGMDHDNEAVSMIASDLLSIGEGTEVATDSVSHRFDLVAPSPSETVNGNVYANPKLTAPRPRTTFRSSPLILTAMNLMPLVS